MQPTPHLQFTSAAANVVSCEDYIRFIERWHISETYDYYNQSHNQNYNHIYINFFYNSFFFLSTFKTFFFLV